MTEIAEEVVEWTSSKRPLGSVGAALAGLVTGAVVGFLISSKIQNRKYQELAEMEIAEAKRFYTTQQAKEKTPEEIVRERGYEQLEALTADYQSSDEKIDTVVENLNVEVKNIFVNENLPDGFDEVGQQQKREAGVPHVIAAHEFASAADGFDEVSLTYYEGDATLVEDLSEEVIEDELGTVGRDNLHFGVMSGEPHVVYISNPKNRTLYEVTRSTGKYAVEVLGYDDTELQHDDGPRVRKFRSYD